MNEVIQSTCDQFLAGYHREQEGLEHHWNTHDERGRLTPYGMGVDRAQKEAKAEQERIG